MGVIGAGLWGNMHASTFGKLPETELAGVCDLDESRPRAMKETFGAAKSFTTGRRTCSPPASSARPR